MLPQNMLLWYDYFELKALENQHMQKKNTMIFPFFIKAGAEIPT